jgi:hypothetical protein
MKFATSKKALYAYLEYAMMVISKNNSTSSTTQNHNCGNYQKKKWMLMAPALMSAEYFCLAQP